MISSSKEVEYEMKSSANKAQKGTKKQKRHKSKMTPATATFLMGYLEKPDI